MATEYLVLRRQTGDGSIPRSGYMTLAKVEASGAHAAIRQIAGANDPPEGVYVAVPTSNWTEETVTVERRDPILRIGGQVTIEEALADEDAKGGD